MKRKKKKTEPEIVITPPQQPLTRLTTFTAIKRHFRIFSPAWVLSGMRLYPRRDPRYKEMQRKYIWAMPRIPVKEVSP